MLLARSTRKDKMRQAALAFESFACKRINRYHNSQLLRNVQNVLISLKMKTFKSQAISASIASSSLWRKGQRNLSKNHGMLLFCFPITFKTVTKSV